MSIKRVDSVRINDVLKQFDDVSKSLKEADAKEGDWDGYVDKSETHRGDRMWFNRLAKLEGSRVSSGCGTTTVRSARELSYEKLNELREDLEYTMRDADLNDDGKVARKAVEEVADKKTLKLFDLLADECRTTKAPEDVEVIEEPVTTVTRTSSGCGAPVVSSGC